MEGRRVKKRPFHHGSTTSLLLTLHHLSATPPLPPTHRKIKHTQSERTGLRWGNRGGAQSHLCYSAHAAAEAPVTWSRDPCPKQIWSRSSGVKLIKYIITNETNKIIYKINTHSLIHSTFLFPSTLTDVFVPRLVAAAFSVKVRSHKGALLWWSALMTWWFDGLTAASLPGRFFFCFVFFRLIFLCLLTRCVSPNNCR